MQRCGFQAQGFYVMDGSKRSAHANAYFTGFGAAKRVVFYDTLLARLTPGEVDAVLAHELGHFRHRHILKRSATMFALSLAAEGSCTIGGNLATNAGGTQVLRYGNARELCLGLEVVTPQGDVLRSLSGLRKDNTGYDLRDLYIGSEGTLGIITAATLKLHPMPAATLTALAICQSPEAAVALLRLARQRLSLLWA
jgi:FAD/FMN-containing dehydrogenase